MDIGDVITMVASTYQFCNELNNGYIRYKNHAQNLRMYTERIEEIYNLSKDSKYQTSTQGKEVKEKLPKLINEFYNYVDDYNNLVRKIAKKSFVKRLWYLKRNDDKMIAMESRLELIMKGFNFENYVNSEKLVNGVDDLKKQVNELADIVKKNEERKKEVRANEEREQQKFINNILDDDKLIYQHFIKENKNGEQVDEFKKDEIGNTILTLNMINNVNQNPEYTEYAEKMMGYMKRKSKIAKETKSIPSWFIDESFIDATDDVDSLLGSGSYCVAQKCIYNGAYAVKKTFDIGKMIENNNNNQDNKMSEKDLYMREIEVWSRIKSHPYVLQFYGACHVTDKPFIISEYCSKGTVKTYINKKTITPADTLNIMDQISAGLFHLHQNHIIHGDLKSDNVLMTEEGKPKICDFGLSVYRAGKISIFKSDKVEKLVSNCFITDAVRWKAPELFSSYNTSYINDNSNISSKKYKDVIGKISTYSDIFSLGRLYYEIISKKNPFFEVFDDDQVETLVINEKYPSRVHPEDQSNILYSDDVWNILLKTWEYDPFDRINLLAISFCFKQILKQNDLRVSINMVETNPEKKKIKPKFKPSQLETSPLKPIANDVIVEEPDTITPSSINNTPVEKLKRQSSGKSEVGSTRSINSTRSRVW